MTKDQKIKIIQKVLNHYYPNPKVPLKHKSTYTLLIAVLLSAMATDKKVNEITPILFKKANTAPKMAKLSVKEILKIIKPIGLAPQKAKAIFNLSKILQEKYKGKVPNTFKELESLPGVGHKTASVVMAHAFHVPAFPVDTHIHRCAKRWNLTEGKTRKQTEEDLKELFPKRYWIKLHLQIIYFGRNFCKARGHKKDKCPICQKL
ncbi:MAG: endonuclease III [Parachlamydiales bacterium]|nr:endonuclease III [Parachlamydiales bacterium]